MRSDGYRFRAEVECVDVWGRPASVRLLVDELGAVVLAAPAGEVATLTLGGVAQLRQLLHSAEYTASGVRDRAAAG